MTVFWKLQGGRIHMRLEIYGRPLGMLIATKSEFPAIRGIYMDGATFVQEEGDDE